MRSACRPLAHNLAVVEVMLLAIDDLIRLVSLAGDENDVAATRSVERARDSFATIDNALDVCAVVDARDDLVDNRSRLFAARIVARDNHSIREARTDCAHLRT